MESIKMDLVQFIKFVLVSSFAVSILGCANSASHHVLKQEQVGDQYLSCKEIKTQKRKAQVVINGVEQDKNDMTGADVMDGILWFPFNVIAKHSNYSSATKAAEGRIEHLTLLEVENGCRQGNSNSTKEDDAYALKLRQLNNLYKEGLLTDQEYLEKKKMVLESLEADISSSDPVASKPSSKKEVWGRWMFQAENTAKEVSKTCNNVELMNSKGMSDFYTASCENQQVVMKCDYGQCKVLQ